MAASRKLHGEIDRCLKKVAEGVEQFEDIWKKVHNANNTNQKEKYEADLKKEIKKLQRLRDQIKSWLQSGEIKDKAQLLENRKLIETQMERFKVVERETKTKAYSKEGLGAAQNKDPAQKERDETNRWLSDCIDNLNIQLDQFESEIESLLAAGKKKKIDRDKSDRVDGLRHSLERHRFHIGKLEILMRMLNNESINCDEIKKLKEDIEYYIESSQDPDFMENEGLYDDIVMEDLDYPAPDISVAKVVPGSLDSTEGSTPSSSVCGSSPAPSPAVAPNNHANDHADSHLDKKRLIKSTEESRTGSTPVKPQVVRPTANSVIAPIGTALSNHSSTTTSSKTSNSSSTPTKPVSGSTSQSTPNNSSTSSGLSNHINSSQMNNRELSQSNTTSIHNSINLHSSLNSISNSISHPISNGPVSSNAASTVGSTVLNSAAGPASAALSASSANLSTASSSVSAAQLNSNSKSESGVSLKEMAQRKLNEVSSSPGSTLVPDASRDAPTTVSNGNSTPPSSAASCGVSAALSGAQPNARDKPSPPVATNETHIPPLLGVAPLGPTHLSPEHKLHYERLQSAYYHMPHPSDSEKFRLHFPRQPLITPAYYPQSPLPMSDSVDFFQRLSTETLFFIFYYMEGTKAQYLAAKALKKQSWRFHTKHMRWFQRHEEPKAITDEFEQGTYIYFDYENWGQRKKENFIFEYRYLEDRDLN